MKLVKAIGEPCEMRYDGKTVVQVPLDGILLPDKVAWALAERRNVSVEDAPEAPSEASDLEIPTLTPANNLPEVSKEHSPEPGVEVATPTIEELISQPSQENV